MTPELRDALEIVAGRPTALDGRKLSLQGVHAVSHRRFSHLAKVGVLVDGETRTAYVKVVRPKDATEATRETLRLRLEHEVSVMVRLAHALKGHRHVGAVEPLLCVPEALLLMTLEVRGMPLADLLSARARWWPRQVGLDSLAKQLGYAGLWLAMFQQALRDHPSDEVIVADLRAYLDVRLQRLKTSSTCGERWRDDVLRLFDAYASAVEPEHLQRVPVHADYAPGNIIIGPDRATGIDLSMVRQGLRYHDVTHLDMHLDLMTLKPQFRSATLDPLRMAFARGFEDGGVLGTPVAHLSRLLHTINHMSTVVLRRSGWRDRLLAGSTLRFHEAWLNARARQLGTAMAGRL